MAVVGEPERPTGGVPTGDDCRSRGRIRGRKPLGDENTAPAGPKTCFACRRSADTKAIRLACNMCERDNCAGGIVGDSTRADIGRRPWPLWWDFKEIQEISRVSKDFRWKFEDFARLAGSEASKIFQNPTRDVPELGQLMQDPQDPRGFCWRQKIRFL